MKAAKEEIDGYFRGLTKEARDYAAMHGVDLDVMIRQGHEVEEIVTLVFERVLGSTAQSIVRHAPYSVLLAK